MKNIQIVLNKILSKEIFKYILIDKNFTITSTSDGIGMYFDSIPKNGDDIFEFMPELVGIEDEIENVFKHNTSTFVLESVNKGEYYINISIEHYDHSTAMILFHNISEVTLSKQKLLQYSNESILLNRTLQKIIDNQNALLFVVGFESIVFANKQYLDYFKVADINEFKRSHNDIYFNWKKPLDSYNALFDEVDGTESYITINDDTFILQSTMIEPSHKLFTLSNVTELSKESTLDPLTGIYKKNYFITQVEKILNKKETFAIIVIDLDDFKLINDNYGHLVGDSVLKEFTSVIKKHIRKDDIFARWGGEEFLLLFQECALSKIMEKLENLRNVVNAYNFNHIDKLTASFGASFSKPTDTIETLLSRSDKALYEAKSTGKNKVVFKKD
jgi:diguanylate cyclase (GGDEF)-like protein